MRYGRFLSSFLGGVLFASSVIAGGMDFCGCVDGFLTWKLGTIEPGKSAEETVIFAYEDSRDELVELLERARRQLPGQKAPPSAKSPEDTSEIIWLENSHTDLALESSGGFSGSGRTMALKSKQGGQLRQFGYYIHYNDGRSRRAGIPIRSDRRRRVVIKKDQLENLRILEPVRLLSRTCAAAALETADGKLRLVIRSVMGDGPVAGLKFMLSNIGEEALCDVRLSVFADIDAAGTSGNDYGILDPDAGGLLVVDQTERLFAVMAGLDKPAWGYCGLWICQKYLYRGDGIAIEQWKQYTGLPGNMEERMFQTRWIPSLGVEPDEPVTGTLSAEEARAVLEDDWLFQAEQEPLEDRALKEIGWALALAARLASSPGTPDLSRELAQLQVLQQLLESFGEAAVEREAARQIYLAVRRVKRRIMFSNPVIDFSSLLFIDNPYPMGSEWLHEAIHRLGHLAVAGGRLLVLDGLHPGGEVRKLAHEKAGSFWRPDLSFDASKVLFCFKGHDEKSFHLYEINVDGSGLRQLTYGDYDDLDPIYLPDGHIMFSTTRANTYIRCGPFIPCFLLARCDGDGRNIYIISQGNESEWLPSLLRDGRVIYSRWEYTDKALWRVQSLWTTNQDGTQTATFWGNQSIWPDHTAEARQIPGSRRFMFRGTAHHNWFTGSIGILDPRTGFNFPHGLTKVTCETPWPECSRPPLDRCEAQDYHTSGGFTAYKNPYPLSEEDFLVSACDGDKFKLYLMGVHGNRELIYEGGYNIWHAMPLKPRRPPPVHFDRVAWPGKGDREKEPEQGVFYSPNIYQGVSDLPRGKAKFLRVIQSDHKTYSTWFKTARHSGPGVSVIQEDSVKRILGTVPIEPDGSVYFKVAPGKALHFQLVDEHYRALQTMRTFTGVMPGEIRGCLGCHELHSVAPPNKAAAAMRRKPSELTPPPWGDESVGYERFVQPVLDKYCGTCHQGSGKARAKLDLTFREGDRWFYTEPYLTLVGKIAWGPKEAPKDSIAGAILCENYNINDPNSIATFRPMNYLSYRSRLIENALSGSHHGVRVDAFSLRRLIAWVDANCPYRGDEEVREIPDPNFAGIELLAVRPRVRSAPVIERP